MYCGESDTEALDTAGECILAYLRFFSGLGQRGSRTAQPRGSDAFANVTIEALDREQLVLVGAPDKLVRLVRWAHEYYGLDYFLLEVGQGGLPHADVVRSLERFARHVMPAFGGPA
jgi:hypothetical protein